MSTDSIDGAIARVLFHKPSKFSPAGTPYLIARLTSGDTVKGEMLKPIEGAEYRFYGEWRTQKSYGTAFEFVSYEPVIERSASGAEQYLATHVDGIGRVKAARLADHFGADTIDVMVSEPERAKEVDGITDAIVEAIRNHFNASDRLDPRAHARLIELFARDGHKISKKIIKKLLKTFGSNAPDMICQHPYLLLGFSGIGWKTADSFAMATARYDPRGIDRIIGALTEALSNVINEGHTVAFKADVIARAEALLGYRLTDAAWAAFAATDEVVDLGSGKCTTQRLATAEQSIAESLAALALAAEPLEFTISTEGLADDQADAIEVIQEHGVCALVGPPGTGKSYCVSRVIRSLIDNGENAIQVVAPTGKAAKRAAELLASAGITTEQVPTSTIHRALAPTPGDESVGVPSDDAKLGREREAFRFGRNERNPLECRIVFVDECSMVDVRLMASFLAAVAPGTRIVFIGDENQLPSVAPGSVLRDLLAGGLPTAKLRDIKRSDGGGRVVRACHAIIAGREPQPAAMLAPPTENWVHLEESNPAKIAETIIELHRIAQNKDPFWDYQVVSAQKGKHPFACDYLNERLSDLLNPDPTALAGALGATPQDQIRQPFRVGDKVIRLKNGTADELRPADPGKDWPDWQWEGRPWECREIPIVNGDMGTVRDIVLQGEKAWVVVAFRDPDRLCRIPYDENHLALAYAITVHKCVHPDTLVETKAGLLPIKSIPPFGTIATLDGAKRYHNHVTNPDAPALRIIAEDGYEITVTPDHKMEVYRDGLDMIEAHEASEGDWVRLRLGMTVDSEGWQLLPFPTEPDVRAVKHQVPDFMSPELAEFLGLMVADGTVYKSGFRLAKRHADVLERFRELCVDLFSVQPKLIRIGNTFGYEVASTYLAAWLLSLGGLSPNAKDVPECVMRCPIEGHAAFLRGLFEDGCALMKNGHLDHIEWASAYPSLVNKVRTMLLRFGIVTGTVKGRPGSLYIYGSHAKQFAQSIGFISQFKQCRALSAIDTEKRYRIPIERVVLQEMRGQIGKGSWTLAVHQHAMQRGYISRETAKRLVQEGELPKWILELIEDRLGWHFVRIKRIEHTACPSMCVEVPEGHRFLQNGFPFGNSQGSGFPVVIVPCHTSFYFDTRSNQGLWCRELFYTAISRAEQVLVTVGQWAAVRQAIARQTVGVRRTRLAELMRGCGDRAHDSDSDSRSALSLLPTSEPLGVVEFDMETV